MEDIRLIERNLPYDPEDLNRWKKRRRLEELLDNRIPGHVRDFLIKKVRNRKEEREKSRLFSEAMALNYFIDSVKDNLIWYSSFKWLTASKWLTGKTDNELQTKFFKDISKYFKLGKIDIAFIQRKAKAFKRKDGGQMLGFTKSGKVRNSTAPDIWLYHKDEGLMFVEAKREEGLEPHQIAGIALIRKYFGVHTYVVRFYPNTYSEEPEPKDHTKHFTKFFELV